MFLAAFTSAFALCPQATHTKLAWLLRLSAAMCLQGLQVCGVYAGVTGLRRVRSFHFLDPPGRLLLQPAHERAPTGFEDALVEPGLRSDVPARVLHGPPRGAGHTFDVEVLEADHVEPAGEVGAGLLKPVFAPVAIPGFHSANQDRKSTRLNSSHANISHAVF